MVVLFLIYFVLVRAFVGQASSSGGLSSSPDGLAYTTDYGVNPGPSYRYHETIRFPFTSNLPELQIGQHYYLAPREEDVNIERWVVELPRGRCIHEEPYLEHYHGVEVSNDICYQYYLPGWLGYCGDCGEQINSSYYYMTKETANELRVLPAQGNYYYVCPICDGLEQGISYVHQCKTISYNRYQVEYHPNVPSATSVKGVMLNTRHMYDNAKEYEGEASSNLWYSDERLRKNTYQCLGYEFMGWNTTADGSGISYSDEETILNLTDKNNHVVTLYAVWKESNSSLAIDPNGGRYLGQEDILVISQGYGSDYVIDLLEIEAPKGYVVSFEGSDLEQVETRKEFSHISFSDLEGELLKENYYFTAVAGTRDLLVLEYEEVPLVLPEPEKENLSFVAWYLDANYENLVGFPGESCSFYEDTILYARWEELKLSSEVNLSAYQGSGAVDLFWEQKDDKYKFYQVYQSRNQKDWTLIHSDMDSLVQAFSYEEIELSQSQQGYLVKQAGMYQITLTGASGGDYQGKEGGLGGQMVVELRLEKGDYLEFYLGEEGQTNRGGNYHKLAAGGDSNPEEGAGGGEASLVYLNRDGKQSLLLVAGGGGGANAFFDGGSGGSSTDYGEFHGTDGAGGGGGGYYGGKAGFLQAGNITMLPIKEPSLTVSGYDYGDAWGVRAYSYHIYGTEEIHGAKYMILKDKNNRNIYLHYLNLVDFHDLTSTNKGTAHYTPGWLTYYYTSHHGEGHEHTNRYHSMKGTICNGELFFYTKWEEKAHSVPSEGGGNYFNKEFVAYIGLHSLAGIQEEGGRATIQLTWLDYEETNNLEAVMARDVAIPYPVERMQIYEKENQEVRLVWEPAMDRGTSYFHKVISYIQEGDNFYQSCESNQSEDIIRTGIAGYYYYLDDKKEGEVTVEDLFTKQVSLDLNQKYLGQYIHIAAVDYAGNLSTSYHYYLPTEGFEFEPSKISTKQVLVEQSAAVYQKDESVFYVRADGLTEHRISVGAFVEGMANRDYLIEELSLHVEMIGKRSASSFLLDHVMLEESDERWLEIGVGTTSLQNISQDLALVASKGYRDRSLREVELQLAYSLSGELHLEPIFIYPSASATYQSERYESLEQEDREHGIVWIPDAIPPKITGLEELEDLELKELDQVLLIQASDEESGLRECYVQLQNKDNGLQETYHSQGEVIEIQIVKENLLFQGELEVAVVAVDQVGNESRIHGEIIGFSLEASIEKLREPTQEAFKAGEVGVIHFKTTAYASQLTIQFREPLEDLYYQFVYEVPSVIEVGKQYFQVPLGTPDGEYQVQIIAYKLDGTHRELSLNFTVKGSITDELRTRIRYNGK